MNVSDLLDRVVAIAQASDEFQRLSRHVDSLVRLGFDEDGFLVRFRGGRLLDIVPDRYVDSRWDYEICGPLSDWERVWNGEIDLAQAIIPMFGAIVVRGNRVLFAADTEPLMYLFGLLPRAARELNGSPATEDDGISRQAEGSEFWSIGTDVIGRYADVQGVRTYYETIGESEGSVAFVGVHTAGRDGRQWQRMGEELSVAGRFYSVDLPGHGKSWPAQAHPGCLTTMDDMSSFVGAFRRAIGIDRPTVFLGCSVGGNLALQVAADFPSEFAAVISMQGADYTPTQPAEALALMDHPRVNPAWHHVHRTIGLTGHRTSPAVGEYLKWEAQNYSSVSIMSDLQAYTNFDMRSRSTEIQCPVLFIRGADDWIVSPEMVRDSAARLTNAAAVEVDMPEGVGHFSHVEQPEESGARVLDFLSRNGLLAGSDHEVQA